MPNDRMKAILQKQFECPCLLSATHGQQVHPFGRRTKAQCRGGALQRSLLQHLPISGGQLLGRTRLAIGQPDMIDPLGSSLTDERKISLNRYLLIPDATAIL